LQEGGVMNQRTKGKLTPCVEGRGRERVSSKPQVRRSLREKARQWRLEGPMGRKRKKSTGVVQAIQTGVPGEIKVVPLRRNRKKLHSRNVGGSKEKGEKDH